MTQSELIKWYEERLEKVIAFWSNAHNGSEYIEQVKKDLEEVKAGRNW
jgi:phosphopantothenate synthetase